MTDCSGLDLRHDALARAYVKDEVVGVRFAPVAGALVSRVGPNRYDAGDALVTGSDGDTWSVRRAVFDDTYVPEPGGVAGVDGQYRNVPRPVLARQFSTPFHIRRQSGDRLDGAAGDWLLQYAPGDHGIASAARFAAVYRPAEGRP